MHVIEPIFKTSSSKAWKTGVRVLGIAESFNKDDRRSILAGVIMRGDYHIDGFGVCTPTIGGTDSTEKLIDMYKNLNRDDIHSWLLGGSIISWFNVIDLHRLNQKTDIPVICVSYSPSEGITKYLQEYFPDDWKQRANIVGKNGLREELILTSGMKVFILRAGIELEYASSLIELFTTSGKIPEPVKVARILASSIRRDAKALVG